MKALIVLALLLFARPVLAAKVIAILPLDISNTEGKLSQAARVDLEEMLRDVASDALAPAGWTVLTGETMLQVLQDNGVDGAKCGDQNCHLSMAREIKAEKFLSGNVRYVEGEFTASIRLIDTTTGRILASQSIEGGSVKALRKEFRAKSDAFFSKGGLLTPSAPVVPLTPVAPAGMVHIPGGTFAMGWADESDTMPITMVTLSPYFLDKTEVTTAAYSACVKSGRCTTSKKEQDCNATIAGHENHPINCVDWKQAKAFCATQGGRLPTEAEWEFAARGTDGRQYPWGNEEPGGNRSQTKMKGTAEVGTHPEGASPFGVLDMAGNVEEWVLDGEGHYPGGEVKNWKNDTGEVRGYRGGSWSSSIYRTQSTSRDGSSQTDPAATRGFRCARDIKQ